MSTLWRGEMNKECTYICTCMYHRTSVSEKEIIKGKQSGYCRAINTA